MGWNAGAELTTYFLHPVDPARLRPAIAGHLAARTALRRICATGTHPEETSLWIG